MQNTPKGLRIQIGFFGRRNAGKSSLLNALVQQDVVIVSDVPGTTTDPVQKAMELPPLGPVLFIDTAGLDEDDTPLGQQRVERTLNALDQCDIVLLVIGAEWTETEERISRYTMEHNVPLIIICTKSDTGTTAPILPDSLKNCDILHVSSKTMEGIAELRAAIIKAAPDSYFNNLSMLGELAIPGETVLLITPIDSEAPKGRMILPQVQAIRDTLDNDAMCIVVKENRIQDALDRLKTPPILAVTDSQAFGIVSKIVPDDIHLTSFSILLARMKGDLNSIAAGAAAIGNLSAGSKVLIAEACTHHPISDDIGRVKLPGLIRKKINPDIQFEFVSGPDFPQDLSQYSLVLHCGACTFNRKAVLARILRCREQNVPFSNYGVALAYLHGILERALRPFPNAYSAFLNAGGK